MISIIIPIYNQASHLPSLLESISRQTYDNYEIIIVNDGSTDNVIKVLEKYKKIFGHKFSYLEQENRGANAARNRGARLAKGEYIIFCDADIIIQPDMLELMRRTLKHNPPASFCYSSFKWGVKTFRLWPYSAEKLRQMPYIHTTSLIRRKDFPEFDEAIKRLQDWDLWLTMLEQGKTGIWLDKILFTVKPGGTMSNWLPSLAYKLLPFLPNVKKYKQATQVIKTKHHLP
ncbi:MAG: glycosyltransferase family A protein [bacterium]|nr:glycosyltransferase family A protein [bacterium]